MYLPGGDGNGPDRTVVIPASFADGGGKPADADTVATHDGGLHLTVLIGIAHVHGLRVLFAKLEDVADLNASGGANALLAADRAYGTRISLGNIDKFDG